MSLKPFSVLTSRVLALPQEDIDTDQIVPARFLTMTDRAGLEKAAFHDWRFDRDGEEKPGNPFDRADLDSFQVIVAGDNFGCGSSREHAPWALEALGFRVVISTKIADIFRSNALKNGIVAIEVPEEIAEQLLASTGEEVTVDLEQNELRFGNHVVPFDVDPFARRSLLEGKDNLDMLVSALAETEKFEKAYGR